MSAIDHSDFTPRHRSNATPIGFRLLMAVFLLGFFTISSASAQQVAHYSDSWLSGDSYTGTDIESDEDSVHPITVVGCGVTDDSYESDGHTYNIRVKLTSPSGRVSEDYGSDYAIWYARTEVELPWDSDDIGQYFVRSSHWSHCPYDPDGYSFVSGISSFGLPVGISFSCYLKQFVIYPGGNAVTAKYRVIENCDATCKSETATITFRRGPTYTPKEYLLVAEPYIYTPFLTKACGHITTWRDLSSCNTCLDVDAP